MALLEDILGIILIVFFLVAASVFTSSKIISDQSKAISEEQTNYLFDYYSTSINTFIHWRENNTGIPMHVLIGDYINLGSEMVSYNDQTINITERGNSFLEEIFPQGHYMEVIQLLTNTSISFVLDGAPSKHKERVLIKENLPNLVSDLRQVFAQDGAELDVRVFILGNPMSLLQGSCMDEGFKDLEGEYIERCQNIKFFEDMYDFQKIMSEPDHESWSKTNEEFLSLFKKNNFLQSDWLAGVAYAETFFRENHPDDYEDNLHVIVLLSDQLSGTSYHDDCFENENVDVPTRWRSCLLCYMPEKPDGSFDCPIDRSYREDDFEELISFLNDSDSVVISLFSVQESFPYYKTWNNQDHPDLFAPIVSNDPPNEQKTKCDTNLCVMCNATNSDDWDSEDWIDIVSETLPGKFVLYGEPCQEEAQKQMQNISSRTRGESLNIKYIDQLTTQITSVLQNIIFDRRIEFGERHPERTRYVFERKLFLTGNRQVSIYLEVYDTPI